MVVQLPERQMHWVRWILTIGWLLLIASLFYDPWTAALTEPDHPWSPVRDALEEGYVNYSSSLEVLQQMRQELGIPDDEHREVLEELGIEDSELLNPNRQRTLENQLRLSGYQKSLERLMRLQ